MGTLFVGHSRSANRCFAAQKTIHNHFTTLRQAAQHDKVLACITSVYTWTFCQPGDPREHFAVVDE
jgi:hypothetical protein